MSLFRSKTLQKPPKTLLAFANIIEAPYKGNLMPLAPTSKAPRGRPTKGRKMAFHAPLPPSKAAVAKAYDQTDRTFCRIYCKDAIGSFLGLPLANPRFILADPNNSLVDIPQTGDKVLKAVPDRVGAKPFTLLLQPGTVIRAATYAYYGPDGAPGITFNNFQVKTLQIFVPAYITVRQMIEWLQEGRKSYFIGEGQSGDLPGMTSVNYDKIIALTTPAQRTYTLESSMYPNRNPFRNRVTLDDPNTALPVGP